MGARARKRGLSTEDVLNGAAATAAELIQLIREENPTGRALPRSVETERYRRKSALQSALVERYPDDLVILRDDPDSDVVSIRHVMLGADACHALLGELSSDARSIAVRMLDLADTASRGSPPAAPASGRGVTRASRSNARASLTNGDACLAEYDFEGARENYTSIWEATSSIDAMVRLLRLLVDHLGADEEATALASSLPPTVGACPEVRALLALAYARRGEEVDAQHWLVGADERRSAEAWATLALTTVRRGDLDAAANHARRAKAADPSAPKVLDACKEVTRAEDTEMAELESALQALGATGDQDAAERFARQLLVRFARSRVARRFLDELEESRRTAANRTLLQRCMRAAEQGEARTALALGSRIEMASLTPNEREATTELQARLRRELAAEERSARVTTALT